MRDFNITTVSGRRSLGYRTEPYWRRLEGTGFLGFRKKSKSAPGNWIARWRDRNGKLHYKPLGKISKGNSFNNASKAARDWFLQCEQGVTRACTVAEGCKAYLKNMLDEKPDCTIYSQQILKKHVIGTKFGRLKLDELLPQDVREWRNNLVTEKRAEVTANRILTSLKAALNFAYREGMTTSNRAWSVVSRFSVPTGKRENFLTKTQVRDMLDVAPPDLKALLTGFLYTGCRPGELVNARAKDLNIRAGTLTLMTSKGRDGRQRTREVPLAGERLAFFKEQRKDRIGNASLMVRADGEQWNKMSWSRGITQIREKVDALPDNLCAYDLRHTTISNWLAAGVPIERVAKICGTSIGMIEKNYFKWIKTDVADQLAAIEII